MVEGISPSHEFSGTGVAGAAGKNVNPRRGMVHLLAYTSDDQRRRGYSYEKDSQAEVYVDASALLAMGKRNSTRR
eukprot:12918203-Prorocentrum_lima.AAC.1